MKYTIDERGIAVGECSKDTTRYDIETFLKRKGYYSDYIEIWYDEKDKIYRWRTDVTNI